MEAYEDVQLTERSETARAWEYGRHDSQGPQSHSENSRRVLHQDEGHDCKISVTWQRSSIYLNLLYFACIYISWKNLKVRMKCFIYELCNFLIYSLFSVLSFVQKYLILCTWITGNACLHTQGCICLHVYTYPRVERMDHVVVLLSASAQTFVSFP